MPRPTSATSPVSDELGAVFAKMRGLMALVFVFSVFVNLLMLTGPLYMLQVYDRVLGSRSEETLVALSILLIFLFVMMGVLDHARGRVMARVGARFQSALDERVFAAHLRRTAQRGSDGEVSPLRHVEAVQRLLASPVFLALFDLPWTPFFIGAIFIFHPWLGWLAVAGGAVLLGLALLNRWLTSASIAGTNSGSARAEATARQMADEAELVQSLGMRGAAHARWMRSREVALEQSMTQSDRSGFFTVTTKTTRLFLQSAMLGLGAWLVLQNELTAGAMIAGSILLGRALAPVEMVVGQWQAVQGAWRGRAALRELLRAVPPEAPRTPLPVPAARLAAEALTVVPPGGSQASLRAVSFRLAPGQALGVIGESGAGKSTLARAITGAWTPAGGRIRLDSATLDQYDPDILGNYIGYLPQTVTLFDGTIAENIARLQPDPDPDAIHAAARKAAAHEMIVHLPDGYDTQVRAAGARLSGGQIQRIGLARAMYGAPKILVLDEPNSNLDNDGTEALNRAIREMKADGGAIVIIAHRPAAIRECDLLLRLEHGVVVAFGPRDEVLRKTVKNHAQLAAVPAGGVT